MSDSLRLFLGYYLSDPLFYLQLFLFAVLVVASFGLARGLKRAVHALPGWRRQHAIHLFFFPLLGLIGGRIISEALERQGLEPLVFNRLYPLFWILFFYRGALAMLQRYDPDDAESIRRRILVPLAVLFVLLRLAGQLSGLLTLLNNVTLFTLGEGEQSFTLSLSLLLFGPLTLFLIYAVAQGVRALLTEELLPGAGFSPSRSYATGTLVSYVVLIGGLLTALGALGIDVTTLTVVSSALAVGIGFGMQNTVNNFVSGFLLMFDPFFSVGDLVEVSDERGVIQRIGIRNTMIEAADGTQIILPNATLASSPVLNLSRSNRPTKVTIPLPVPLATDPHRVAEEVRTILAAVPGVRAAPAPAIALKSFAPGQMNFEINLWVDSPSQADSTATAVNLQIWQRLDELGILLLPVPPPVPPPG